MLPGRQTYVELSLNVDPRLQAERRYRIGVLRTKTKWGVNVVYRPFSTWALP